jgi:hypothetical protein
MPAFFAVIICHGSYHTPELYLSFLSSLKGSRIEAHSPQLPTSDLSKLTVGDILNPDFNRDPPPGGYPQPADDVKIVQTLLKRLIVEDGKNIIVLGHSSGGFVATASATLTFKPRFENPKACLGVLLDFSTPVRSCCRLESLSIALSSQKTEVLHTFHPGANSP